MATVANLEAEPICSEPGEQPPAPPCSICSPYPEFQGGPEEELRDALLACLQATTMSDATKARARALAVLSSERVSRSDTHRGWLISFDYPPIANRTCDWSATHPDSDGELRIYGKTREALVELIDEWEGINGPDSSATLTEALRGVRAGLEYYAEPNHYRPDSGRSLLLFDAGNKARVALQDLDDLEKLIGDGGTTFFKAMAADPLIQDFNKMLDEERAKRSGAAIGMDPDYLATVTYEDIVACEQRALEAEKVAVRLRRLVRQPQEPGGYVGDTYYPLGGTQASHRWNGKEWEWFPELCVREVE